MKTQLLQDIGDSGAAPPGSDGRRRPRGGAAPGARPGSSPRSPHAAPHTAPPGPPPERPAEPAAQKARPAVWHRAQAAPDAAAQFPEPDRRTAPSVDPPGDVATAAEPDWLAELMRQDAVRADAQQKAVRWRRRVFGWSIGAGVLALVAAGALWMIEARRVDGAMEVVAAGVPAAGASAAGAPAADAGTSTSGPPAPVPAPVPAPGPAAAPTLAPALSSPRPAPTILEEVVKPAEPVSTEAAMPGIQREHAVSKAASGASVERVRSDRRKREETLLQCRALGYDEGQCIRRECGMTRFGLACRGGVMGADVPP